MLGVQPRIGSIEETHEGLEHTLSRKRHRGEDGLFAAAGEIDQLRVGADIGEVALIELNHERHLGDLEAVGLEVFAKIDECGCVVLGLGELRIRDERHAVGPLEHEPARRAVNDLSGHGKELDADGDLFFGLKSKRQHVEKERAIVAGFERHEATARGLIGKDMQGLEVRRLAAQRRTVVDEFDDELFGGKVELQGPSRPS